MRDVYRIEQFLLEFGILWKMHPDLRFGQIVSNLSIKSATDLFYIEDNEMLSAIREQLNGV